MQLFLSTLNPSVHDGQDNLDEIFPLFQVLPWLKVQEDRCFEFMEVRVDQ